MRPDGSSVDVISLSTARAVRMPRTAIIQLVVCGEFAVWSVAAHTASPTAPRAATSAQRSLSRGEQAPVGSALSRDADVSGWCALGHPVLKVGTEWVRCEASPLLRFLRRRSAANRPGLLGVRPSVGRGRSPRCGKQHDRGHTNGGDSVGDTRRGRGGEGAAHSEADRPASPGSAPPAPTSRRSACSAGCAPGRP